MYILSLDIHSIGILLLVACLVAIVAKRLHLPYTVGLVVAGLGLALLPLTHNIILDKDLIFTVFLPPLIFEASMRMHWQDLRRDFPLITVLATLGVLLSATVVGFAMVHFVGWSLEIALLFAVLISATDPVSVIAVFKENKVTGRLLMLVEAESVFNDGTVAVLFFALLAAIAHGTIEPGLVMQHFIFSVAGGVVLGGVVGWIMTKIAYHTDDHLVIITLTTLAAFGSFLLADHFGCSGVIATLTAGIIVGNSAICAKEHRLIEDFWEYSAFLVNSLVFLLTGLTVAKYDLLVYWKESCIAIAFVLVARAVAVYAICFCFAFSSLKVTMSHQRILFWGGLRGVLALALVLGLPSNIPHHDALLAVTFAVAMFSIVVQGITVIPLLKKLS